MSCICCVLTEPYDQRQDLDGSCRIGRDSMHTHCMVAVAVPGKIMLTVTVMVTVMDPPGIECIDRMVTVTVMAEEISAD